MRALIDTCVVIDAMQNRAPFYEDAQKILLLVANKRLDGYLAASSVTDIYYLMHRHTHSDKDSRKVLNTLFHLFELLDTAGIDCRRALSSEMADFEDAVIAEAAARAEMDCIVTRNLKDYEKARAKIYSPFELLELLEENDSQPAEG